MQFQISCGKFHEKSHTKEQSKASVDRSNNKNKPKITQKQRMQPSALTLKKLENYSLLTRHVSSAVLKCLPGCALFIRMLASCFLLTALHTRTYLNFLFLYCLHTLSKHKYTHIHTQMEQKV